MLKLIKPIFLFALFFSPHCLGATADPWYEVNQLVKKGKNQEALDQIQAYLASQPKNAWGRNITQMRFLEGMLLVEEKRTPEAIQVYSKLIQDYPSLPEPYNNLAALYASQGQYEKARDTLEKGLRTDPAYATAYRNLNEIYTQLASQAYDHTLTASKGEKTAPALIKELCDNYGRVANQAVGRGRSSTSDIAMLREIPKSRSSAAAPPSKVDIDEMAMPAVDDTPAVPPAFNNPAPRPAQAVATATPPTSVVTPKETPPAKPTVQPVASSGEDKAVLAAVQAWASSWSRKDVKGYLSFYAKDFHPPSGQSRADWSDLRRERIAKPKSIKVAVEAPKVTMTDATHATVSFHQGYRSDNLQTSTRKELLMVKSAGKWLIQEERVGG